MGMGGCGGSVIVLRVGGEIKIVVGGDRDGRYAFREHSTLIFETFKQQNTNIKIISDEKF